MSKVMIVVVIGNDRESITVQQARELRELTSETWDNHTDVPLYIKEWEDGKRPTTERRHGPRDILNYVIN